jgi:hypothetical protein
MATTQPRSQLSRDEIGRMGEEIYRRHIRAKVYPEHKGRFLVLDVLTGEYELDDDDLTASKRLRLRCPAAVGYGVRVGYITAYTMVGHLPEDEE